MSNVKAPHALGANNAPLQTILEAVNSDYEPTERDDSRLQQYPDIYQRHQARGGTEEWESFTSDTSDTLDKDPDPRPPRIAGHFGPRTRSEEFSYYKLLLVGDG
jgi:hypothetical protein